MNRFSNRVLAAILLLLTSPLLLSICVLQLVIAGSQVFFRQKRIGLKGTSFFILKFRTMTSSESSDKERITKWGNFLRSTSLDELPELWNVLKGEMSLVGPRPLPVHYLQRYSPQQARRHSVQPGITGWAQINGRNNISWERQFELDLWYIDNRNWRLDLKILFLTFIKVLKRENISEPGCTTRSEFRGD